MKSIKLAFVLHPVLCTIATVVVLVFTYGYLILAAPVVLIVCVARLRRARNAHQRTSAWPNLRTHLDVLTQHAFLSTLALCLAAVVVPVVWVFGSADSTINRIWLAAVWLTVANLAVAVVRLVRIPEGAAAGPVPCRPTLRVPSASGPAPAWQAPLRGSLPDSQPAAPASSATPPAAMAAQSAGSRTAPAQPTGDAATRPLADGQGEPGTRLRDSTPAEPGTRLRDSTTAEPGTRLRPDPSDEPGTRLREGALEGSATRVRNPEEVAGTRLRGGGPGGPVVQAGPDRPAPRPVTGRAAFPVANPGPEWEDIL